MQWLAQAPSNIALVKYMGKSDAKKNTPINSSLSYTLNNLISSVSMESHLYPHDIWEPLTLPGATPFILSTAEQTRFLLHLAQIKQRFKYTGTFIVRSCNNFPHSSGLASSASSFAALTKCAIRALCELTNTPLLPVEEQAKISQEGSGSSCRSFFSPWALWTKTETKAIELPYTTLNHQAIIISHGEKAVSSKEAHLRIETSPFYSGRAEQAQAHLKLLIQALESQDWKSAYQICWHEFQNMHELFRTCETPFNYITPESEKALQLLQDLWTRENDGPIITMDAGPNIHLLYRPDQMNLASLFRQHYLIGNYDVI